MSLPRSTPRSEYHQLRHRAYYCGASAKRLGERFVVDGKAETLEASTAARLRQWDIRRAIAAPGPDAWECAHQRRLSAIQCRAAYLRARLSHRRACAA